MRTDLAFEPATTWFEAAATLSKPCLVLFKLILFSEGFINQITPYTLYGLRPKREGGDDPTVGAAGRDRDRNAGSCGASIRGREYRKCRRSG